MTEKVFIQKSLISITKSKQQYPDIVKTLQQAPKRVKVIKRDNENEMLVFFKKIGYLSKEQSRLKIK
jgi:hypothetical protein